MSDETTTSPAAGAAFFDVDRTLLAGASGLHLAAPFRKSGLLTARQLAQTMLVQLQFGMRGSDDAQLDRFTEGVKQLMQGWDHATVQRVIADELENRIHPMVFREAIERIAMHQAQGQKVYAVSATMDEIIEPLAKRLGLDGCIASKMEVVDGTFTGVLLEANHGPDKGRRLRAFAEEHGIDLAASSAYSDSITDEDFLRAVGRPYAVNPDKKLRALAEAEGWGILRFTTRMRIPRHKTRAARAGALALATGVVAARMMRKRANGRRGV
jgi:HAD superfamily hydrolase (TIGR01490 family)